MGGGATGAAVTVEGGVVGFLPTSVGWGRSRSLSCPEIDIAIATAPTAAVAINTPAITHPEMPRRERALVGVAVTAIGWYP
jgi:hypothetical protein